MSTSKITPEASTVATVDVEWLDEDELEHLDEQQRLVTTLARLYVADAGTPNTEPDDILAFTRFIQNLSTAIDPRGSMDEAALLLEQVAYLRALSAAPHGATPPNTPCAAALPSHAAR